MSSPSFDPAQLLDTEYSDDLRTRLTPVPEGDWRGRIKENGILIRKTGQAGSEYTVADVLFLVEDEEVKERTQLKEPTVRASLFLDLKPGTNQLLTEKDNPNANVKLGQLKAACGIKPGAKWSFRQLEGLGCFIKVKHRPNPDDIENPRVDIVAFSKEPFPAPGASRRR